MWETRCDCAIPRSGRGGTRACLHGSASGPMVFPLDSRLGKESARSDGEQQGAPLVARGRNTYVSIGSLGEVGRRGGRRSGAAGSAIQRARVGRHNRTSRSIDRGGERRNSADTGDTGRRK
ncbi:hypothetical protein KM043_008276 [Ampulex compressa]|nr:hypothetical protein KM043_008276 [Ampulex compressa]